MTAASTTRPSPTRRSRPAADRLRPAVVGGRQPVDVAPVAALRLLMSARRVLAESHATTDPLERYAFAHLAALRAAAAVLADRARPSTATKSRRPTSVWRLLVAVAPELEPWAGYFAVGSNKRAAAEAGVRGAVTTREADDLMRDAEAFIALVETMLGVLSLAASGADHR